MSKEFKNMTKEEIRRDAWRFGRQLENDIYEFVEKRKVFTTEEFEKEFKERLAEVGMSVEEVLKLYKDYYIIRQTGENEWEFVRGWERMREFVKERKVFTTEEFEEEFKDFLTETKIPAEEILRHYEEICEIKQIGENKWKYVWEQLSIEEFLDCQAQIKFLYFYYEYPYLRKSLYEFSKIDEKYYGERGLIFTLDKDPENDAEALIFLYSDDKKFQQFAEELKQAEIRNLKIGKAGEAAAVVIYSDGWNEKRLAEYAFGKNFIKGFRELRKAVIQLEKELQGD